MEYIPVGQLKPYEKNTRKHEDYDVSQIAHSIEQYGFNDPIGIWGKDNIIVEGHGRLLAAKKLGMKEVPCIRLDDLTDKQRREYAILHNKTAELSSWDFDLLAEDIGELDFSGFDIDWGLPADVEEKEIIEDEAPEVDEENEPITKLGDIWQLGRHKLICGDSTDRATVERLMDCAKADMILSDPPYGMYLDTDFSGAVGSLGSIDRKRHTRGNKYDKVIGDNDDFKPELITTFFDNFDCKEVFLFGADYFAELLPNKNDGSWLVWDKRKESQADAIGSEFELIWSKNKHKRRVLRHDWFGFLSSQDSKDARNRVHPTQKPVSLLVDIINQWGTDCKNIVDLYGGSGSTLIACEQLDRVCYMAEIDEHYCDVIIKRWGNLTGQKAVKIS